MSRMVRTAPFASLATPLVCTESSSCKLRKPQAVENLPCFLLHDSQNWDKEDHKNSIQCNLAKAEVQSGHSSSNSTRSPNDKIWKQTAEEHQTSIKTVIVLTKHSSDNQMSTVLQ